MLTEEQKQAYVQTINHCPYCHSDNIDAETPVLDEYEDQFRVRVSCVCGKWWVDIYRVVAMEESPDDIGEEL